MHLPQKSLRVIQYSLDFFSLLVSFILAFFCCTSNNELTIKIQFIALLLILNWFLFANIFKLYDEFRSRDFSFELIAILKTISFQLIGIIILIFLVNEYNLRRTFIFVYSASLTILVVTQKYILRKYLNYVRSKGRNIRNLLIIGAGEVGQNFYESIKNNPHYGYRLIGFLDDSKKELLNGKYLGKIEILETLFDKMRIDEVIVALPNYAIEKLEWVMATCNRHTTRVKIIPDYFKFLSERFEISTFGRFPVISVRTDKLNEFHWRLFKRAFDFLFSLSIIILILSWLIPLIFVLQLLLDPGPLFFTAKRWGRDSKPFNCIKFRSMKKSSTNCDSNGRHIPTSLNDNRITKLGKFLRKSNIDELPQFINVLLGQMSVVGPRPHDEIENIEIKDKIEFYMLRHIVKPGITGWAQVNGYRGGTKDLALMKKRTEYDIWYIDNWSFGLDIQIIILTIWNVLKGDKNAY